MLVIHSAYFNDTIPIPSHHNETTGTNMQTKTAEKFEALATDLLEFLKSRSLGHCCRIDYLSEADAREFCRVCRTMAPDAMEFFVVDNSSKDDLSITFDKAVELRNRKRSVLTLFVPPDIRAGAAGSLKNSFERFALNDSLRRATTKLVASLPDTVQTYVKTALFYSKQLGLVSDFEKLDYVLVVKGTPSLSTCGRELWHLGLIPDLNDDAEHLRLEQNARSVEILTRMQPGKTSSAYDRVETLRLADNDLKSELFRFCSEANLGTLRGWQRSFLQPEYANRLTFDAWTFLEVEDADLIALDIDDFCDEADVVKKAIGLKQESDGQALMAFAGKNSFIKVSWKATPKKPSGISKFAVRICSDDNSNLLPEVRVAARSRTHKFSLAQLGELTDEKLYAWIEVVALDANMEEIRDPAGKVVIGKSQGFWLCQQQVVSTADLEDRCPATATVGDALVEQAFTDRDGQCEISKVSWDSDQSQVVVHFKPRASRSIRVSPILAQWEQKIFSDPTSIGSYSLEIPPQPSADHCPILQKFEVPAELQDSFNKFRLSRRKLFEEACQSASAIFESWTLAQHKERIREYLKTYTAVLIELTALAQQRKDDVLANQGLRQFLALDTITLSVGRGANEWTAMLVGPSHPLRLIWHLSHELLLRHWAAELQTTPANERAKRFSLDSLKRISNLNVPPFAAGVNGETFLYRDNLTPFWAVFFPQNTHDVPYRMGELKRLLRIPHAGESSSQISPKTVAQTLKRYLDLHPYLRGNGRLKIRAINPGAAGQLKDALTKLSLSLIDETIEEQGYDVLLEAPEHVQLLGEAFEDSFQDSSDTSSDLFQNLSRVTLSDFLPKFVYGKKLLGQPPSTDSHIGMLFDFTSPIVSSVSNPPLLTNGSSLELHGLILRYVEESKSVDGRNHWIYNIKLPLAKDLVQHPEPKLTGLLVDAYKDCLEGFMAAVGLPMSTASATACLNISLTAEQTELLNDLHNSSDWVLTLDPYLGVEYFDSPNRSVGTNLAERYVIDYVPEFIEGYGQRLILSTSWTDEAARILDQVLQPMGLESNAGSVNDILRTLKSLSGRLALKVASYPTFAREAVSLAIVLMVLEKRGELKSAFLIPMDSHLDLFRQAANEVSSKASLLRSDVMLVNLASKQPIIRLVEVKYRSGLGIEQDIELLDQIADKNTNSEKVLRQLFFPIGNQRVDKHIQLSRFSNLLEFYMKRAVRYGHMTEEQMVALQTNLAKLHDGQVIPQFQHKGMIVCPHFKEPLKTITHNNNEIWLIGADVIETHTSLHTTHPS